MLSASRVSRGRAPRVKGLREAELMYLQKFWIKFAMLFERVKLGCSATASLWPTW
jgi:hypothetical protein